MGDRVADLFEALDRARVDIFEAQSLFADCPSQFDDWKLRITRCQLRALDSLETAIRLHVKRAVNSTDDCL